MVRNAVRKVKMPTDPALTDAALPPEAAAMTRASPVRARPLCRGASSLRRQPVRKRLIALLSLIGTACSPAAPLASPHDPAGAVADARIPFGDPYRADLVQSADRLLRALKEDGGECLEARFLRVRMQQAANVLPEYRRQLGQSWQAEDLAAAPFTKGQSFRNGAARFAVAVADRPQDGWTGIVIVTNTYWDAASRDALASCRGPRSSSRKAGS